MRFNSGRRNTVLIGKFDWSCEVKKKSTAEQNRVAVDTLHAAIFGINFYIMDAPSQRI